MFGIHGECFALFLRAGLSTTTCNLFLVRRDFSPPPSPSTIGISTLNKLLLPPPSFLRLIDVLVLRQRSCTNKKKERNICGYRRKHIIFIVLVRRVTPSKPVFSSRARSIGLGEASS